MQIPPIAVMSDIHGNRWVLEAVLDDISRQRSGLAVANIAVPYDWKSAAAAATRNGRPDWAEYLSTGRASC